MSLEIVLDFVPLCADVSDVCSTELVLSMSSIVYVEVGRVACSYLHLRIRQISTSRDMLPTRCVLISEYDCQPRRYG